MLNGDLDEKTSSLRETSGSASHLAHLFDKAKKTEILRWYYYSEEFEKKVRDISSENEINNQMARTQIYNEMEPYLPGIKREYLRKKTQKARNIYTLFKEIRIDKIKHITYSADAISSLTGVQIQNIINLLSEKPNNLHAHAHVTEPFQGNDQDLKKCSEAKNNLSHDRAIFRNKALEQYPDLYYEFSSENVDYYGITAEILCPLCKLDHDDEEDIEDMSKTDKILTFEYLDWHAKLTGLPSVLTDRIRYSLYKKYKKKLGMSHGILSEAHASETSLLINSKPENKVSYLSFSEQCEEKGPITFEARPDPELIIKSVLEHFTYLKFRNSFRGIDNYNFASTQPWSSPCPICNGKHGNYGLHGSWYHKNGKQFPYDPELAKLYSQDKLEYCLTCNTSSNKLKFAIVA
ncbi:5904_t:CDS:2 [Paraglomus brasilianum]|uniref:5904_t:CDS:1 n=1 Tax=Paraglomus brasilianum TaxID=144538 RepID=A0A9N9DIL5_9GLOM|nr:5904_t:CDS:2 [Paraglomus brasilianum]